MGSILSARPVLAQVTGGFGRPQVRAKPLPRRVRSATVVRPSTKSRIERLGVSRKALGRSSGAGPAHTPFGLMFMILAVLRWVYLRRLSLTISSSRWGAVGPGRVVAAHRLAVLSMRSGLSPGARARHAGAHTLGELLPAYSASTRYTVARLTSSVVAMVPADSPRACIGFARAALEASSALGRPID